MATIQERASKNGALLSIKYGISQKMVEALYIAVAKEQRAIDREDFKSLVEKEFDSLYELYIRKASCKSEYSRTVAPSQMDAIDTLKNAILKVLEK